MYIATYQGSKFLRLPGVRWVAYVSRYQGDCQGADLFQAEEGAMLPEGAEAVPVELIKFPGPREGQEHKALVRKL